ncbi:SURF1 family protein [Marmoricola sp. Leaf446]|uniref:SURF1 family protein n=1 Tax=Marmoricola sp. Leaf446 TaxID=1736379 RepID=UPI001F36E99D|nr:SURF1 family protein [Marmoricola sp. Leaf446]
MLRPRHWGGHLLLVVALVATTWLGFWQLSAWQHGREAEARDLSSAAPVALTDAMGPDDPFPGQYVGQPVALRGTWVPASTLFVADRLRDGQRGGQRGYWVVTPVLVDGGDGSALPVVRGWSPTPDAAPVRGEVDLTGWLQPSEGSGLPDTDAADDVIPEMRVASITQRVEADLYSGFVVARDASSGTSGLAAVSPESIPEVSAVTSLRNLLYAVQWWVFGGFAVYVWWRWCRDTVEALEREQEAEVEQVGSPV